MPLQAGQRQLKPYAFGGVLPQPGHERLERRPVLRGGRRPQPVVEKLLADRTLRAIQRREHRVEVEVVRRSRIERLLPGQRERLVILRNGGDVARTIGRATPLGAQARHEPAAAAPLQQFPPGEQGNYGSQEQPERHVT